MRGAWEIMPSECETFLDSRKGRARSLAVDGYLHEDQVGIIESRAEELRAGLWTSSLEEEDGFLPYNLVTKAHQMVQDGDVPALEADEVLTDEQRVRVRERIEQWFVGDAGGSP